MVQYEMRANLNKFEGSSSISSDELFGSGPNRSSSSSYSSSFNRTDLTDIKEGVRQGVTKVAGRLSNFASGVMSSVQVRCDLSIISLVAFCLAWLGGTVFRRKFFQILRSCLPNSIVCGCSFSTFHRNYSAAPKPDLRYLSPITATNWYSLSTK